MATPHNSRLILYYHKEVPMGETITALFRKMLAYRHLELCGIAL